MYDKINLNYENIPDELKTVKQWICHKDKIPKSPLYNGNAKETAALTRAELMKARIHPTIGDNEAHLKAISTLLGDPHDPDYFHKNDLRFVKSVPELISAYYRIVPAGKIHNS